MTKNILHTTFKDQSNDTAELIPVRIEFDGAVLAIYPEGYGDAASADGFGCPVLVEFYEGELRVVVWPDIHEENPTVISLEGARESLRTPEADEPAPEKSAKSLSN